MVFAPPQSGKSELASVRLPAFWLGRRPDDPIILTSYAASLAESKSRQSRDVLESPDFQALFPGTRTRADLRAVAEWSIAGHRGGLLAAGVGGGITGRGALLGILDDPLENWQQAESRTIRDRTWEWYRTTFRTRVWEGGAIVLITTRWHEDDIAGRLLAEDRGRWHILRLTAIAEDQAVRDERNAALGLPHGLPDPLARIPGEPLSPRRFSLATLEEIRRDVGATAWAAEYQGSPTRPGGNIFKREWWRRYSPAALKLAGLKPLITVVDSAFKDGVANDFSVAATWGAVGGHYFAMDLWRARVEFPALIAALRDVHQKWLVPMYIEDRASGQSALQVLRRRDGARPAVPAVAIPYPANMSKRARAEAATPYVEAGLVHLPEDAGWAHDFVEEHAAFPGDHDDQVDTTAAALWLLTGRMERARADGPARRLLRLT